LLVKRPDDARSDGASLVRTVIEKLNMQPVPRPIERCGRAQGVGDHFRFVENRDLHENMGELGLGQSRRAQRRPPRLPARALEEIYADEAQKSAPDKEQAEHRNG
jgi:hypothetical protein